MIRNNLSDKLKLQDRIEKNKRIIIQFMARCYNEQLRTRVLACGYFRIDLCMQMDKHLSFELHSSVSDQYAKCAFLFPRIANRILEKNRKYA